MEYNIYDLMDEFADEDIELSPYNAADLRRIEELTMKKIEEQQGRRPAAKKAGRIARALLVAAVVTALCTATVVAAKLGVADSFKGYFGDLTAEQKQVMEALGTTDLQPVTSNGTTITPLAAICDENNYYLRLRIEAPEGTKLNLPKEDEGYLQLWNPETAGDFFARDDYDYDGCSFDCTWSDAVPGDNVLEVVMQIAGQSCDTRTKTYLENLLGRDYTVMSFTDGRPKQLNIHGIWMQTNNQDLPYEIVLEGDWSFEIGLNAKAAPTVYVDASGRATESTWPEPDHTLTLEYFRISPLGMVGEYGHDYDENMEGYGIENCALVMKDGSTLEMGPGGVSMTGRDFVMLNYRFDAPIDVTQVDHIVFGDQIIPVPQTGE